jgi:XTP/dITP diphosphohydrolase
VVFAVFASWRFLLLRTADYTEPVMVLYAATTNPGKLAEFADCASDEGIDVRALPDIAALPEPVEDAATFMGNAEIKAVAYSLASPGLLVFADDSGLEIDALGGAPGVRSARFADDRGYEVSSGAGKDARNNRCVLSLLAEIPDAVRGGRFVCALALARDGEVLLRAEGKVEGEVLDGPRGENGFGYDPLFLLPDLGLTMAELGQKQKWELSHRGNAFRDLLRQLRRADL